MCDRILLSKMYDMNNRSIGPKFPANLCSRAPRALGNTLYKTSVQDAIDGPEPPLAESLHSPMHAQMESLKWLARAEVSTVTFLTFSTKAPDSIQNPF